MENVDEMPDDPCGNENVIASQLVNIEKDEIAMCSLNDISLSTGCLEQIMNGCNVEKPVLQILRMERISLGSNCDYRVWLSDGKYLTSYASFNSYAEQQLLSKNTIICVEKYYLSRGFLQSKLLVIHDFTILDASASKIGEPTNLASMHGDMNVKCSLAPIVGRFENNTDKRQDPPHSNNGNARNAQAVRKSNQSYIVEEADESQMVNMCTSGDMNFKNYDKITMQEPIAGPSGYPSRVTKAHKRPILPSSSEDDEIVIGPLPQHQQRNQKNLQLSGKNQTSSPPRQPKKRKVSEAVRNPIGLSELKQTDNSASADHVNPHLRTSSQSSTSDVARREQRQPHNAKRTTWEPKKAVQDNSVRHYNTRVFHNSNLDRRPMVIPSSVLATAIQVAQDITTPTKPSSPSQHPSSSKSEIKSLKQNSTEPNTQPAKKRSGKFTNKEDKKNTSFTNIKCSLQSIFKPGDNTTAIIQVIDDMVIRSTKICFVAALMVLDMINRNFNTCRTTHDWSFFDLSNTNPQSFITECFHAVSTSRKRQGQRHQFMSQHFESLMTQYNIRLEDVSILNNAFKSLTQLYETNFKNNIIVHAKTRIKALLKLKAIQHNATIPNKQIKSIIGNTVKFMFNPKSKCRRNDELINFILRYIPNPNAIDIDIEDTQTRGFMNLFIKRKWFAFIPFFIKIQREIAQHQSECRITSNKIQVRNFKVVPLHSHRRKHIRIDNVTFKFMLQHLKIHPTKTNPTTRNQVTLTAEEFIAARDPTNTFNPYWFEFLDRNRIRKMERKSKIFNYQIITDGVSVSVEFQRLKNVSTTNTFEEEIEQQQANYQLYRQRFTNQLYTRIIGIDPGYKLYIAAVLKDVTLKQEKHIKISSKEFYTMTRQNYRDKKAKQSSAAYEQAAREDRQNTNEYTEYPSSLSSQYINYIKHSLKFFTEGITIYTTRKYARFSLDQYIRTQQAMDSIVHMLTDNVQCGRILLCIGATDFNPSSPIKKYKRCPGTRKLISYIRKITNCDVIFVDEYKTSKVCGRCQQPFEKQKHKHWDGRGIRHRLCENCQPHDDVISLPSEIVTPKSQRLLQLEKLQNIHNFYVKYPNVSYREAVTHIINLYAHYGHDDNQQNFIKTPFDPYLRETPLKCVWNRDISAARNIIIKGICQINNMQLPVSLRRPQQNDDTTDTDTEDTH